MLSFIPYVGSITGGVTSIGLALAQFPTWTGVAEVAGVFVAGQLLEGYVIYPRFLGDRVELHAVWVIFALFAGGAVFGFLGVLLAVPVAAMLGVLARFWLRRYLASPLYSDPPPGTVGDDAANCRCRSPTRPHTTRRTSSPARATPPRWPGWTRRGPAGGWRSGGTPDAARRTCCTSGPRAAARPCCLARRWTRRRRPAMRTAGAGLAVDDADGAPERPLLHLLNAAAEAGRPVLLAARSPPSRWATRLPDLASRLRATATVELAPPGDDMLRALFANLLAARQLAVPETLQRWMLLRLPRHPAALREAARQLDSAALAAGRVTQAVAAAVVEACAA